MQGSLVSGHNRYCLESQMPNAYTKRQHWVPQMYLRQWGGENHLTVAIGDRILERQRTINFAVQSRMYQFDDLTDVELRTFFDGISGTWNPNLPLVKVLLVPIVLNVLLFRVVKKDWTNAFAREFEQIQNSIDFDGKQAQAYELLIGLARGDIPYDDTKVSRMVDFVRDGFESYHSAIENGTKEYFDRAVAGDLAFMKDDRVGQRFFLSYLYDQFFRTPKYLGIIERLDSLTSRTIGATPVLARYFRYFLPILYTAFFLQQRDRVKMMVVVNKSEHEFVTSDAPVVVYDKNEDGLPSITYFPLSPRSALLFGDRKKVNVFCSQIGRELVDVSYVDRLNREIVASCDKMVFASSSRALRDAGCRG